MLRTTASDNANNWPSFLPALMSADRMTTHSVIGTTPNLAMLGREVLIPATLIAQPPDEPSKPVTPYVTTFRSTIRDVHHRIRLNTGAVANYFDKFVRGSPFHVDQLVWLYWPRPPLRQQKRKLQRLWSGPWKIIKFQSSVVVIIQNLKTNKHQTVHVDRLAPCRSQQREQRDPSDIGVCSASDSQDSYPEHQNSGQTQIRKSGRNRRPPSYLNSYSPE